VLINDMETYDVKNPNSVLASPDTSLVLVRGFLPPGVQKGDRFDIEVLLPSRSETTSLRGGWLMRARMRRMAVIDSSVHTGHVECIAEGAVVVDAIFDGTADKAAETHGRVLGGGEALASRPLGLMVRSEHHSVRTSSLLGAAINLRFHTYDRGVKRGVATPKRDNFVELEVHPHYKHNLARYMQVVQNIAINECPTDRLSRMETLERKLLEPTTAATAALQLEAIGKEAMPILRKGAASEDPEVRFYAAEALAYMDEAPVADALAEAAREEPVFRWHAIAALSAMDHLTAYDALSDLLHVSSAETRYAAFRALRARNPMDAVVRGTKYGNEFTYHTLDTTGPEMVHLARSRVPEIVTFGRDVQLQPPAFLYAGKKIMLKGDGPNRIKLVRFDVRDEDKRLTCSTKLDDVVRSIVELGGGYSDVLQCLLEAKNKGYLGSRVVVDALPRVGRTYRRDEKAEGNEVAEEPTARSPLPEMFRNLPSEDNQDETGEDAELDQGDIDPLPDENKDDGFMSRLGKWF
jgi:hypothetical protein